MVQCRGKGQGVLVTEIIRDEAKPTLGIPALQVKSGQEEQGTASLHVSTSFIPSLYGVHRGKENLINSLKKELKYFLSFA